MGCILNTDNTISVLAPLTTSQPLDCKVQVTPTRLSGQARPAPRCGAHSHLHGAEDVGLPGDILPIKWWVAYTV